MAKHSRFFCLIGFGIFSVLEVSDSSQILINLFMMAWYVTNIMTSLCLEEASIYHYQFHVIIRLTIYNHDMGSEYLRNSITAVFLRNNTIITM